MTVSILYSLHPKSARLKACSINPQCITIGDCAVFVHILPYGGVNICNSSNESVCGNRAHTRAKFGQGGVR